MSNDNDFDPLQDFNIYKDIINSHNPYNYFMVRKRIKMWKIIYLLDGSQYYQSENKLRKMLDSAFFKFVINLKEAETIFNKFEELQEIREMKK